MNNAIETVTAAGRTFQTVAQANAWLETAKLARPAAFRVVAETYAAVYGKVPAGHVLVEAEILRRLGAADETALVQRLNDRGRALTMAC